MEGPRADPTGPWGHLAAGAASSLRREMRRPSAGTLIALGALFVALGGPAQARRLIDGGDIRPGTVGSRQVEDRSLRTRDLAPTAVRRLTRTPDGSVTERRLADGAVTTAKLGAAAVTTGKLGAAAVGSVAVADGSLTAADVARFWGRFSVEVPPIHPQRCWAGEPRGLAPELAHADISQDLVVVSADYRLDRRALTVTPWTSSPSHFALTLCNAGSAEWAGGLVAFRYAVLRVP